MLGVFVPSLVTGTVPEHWGCCSFVLKPGFKDNPVDYRVVSITSVVRKTLEVIFKDRIYMHLVKHWHIWDSQHLYEADHAFQT